MEGQPPGKEWPAFLRSLEEVAPVPPLDSTQATTLTEVVEHNTSTCRCCCRDETSCMESADRLLLLLCFSSTSADGR